MKSLSVQMKSLSFSFFEPILERLNLTIDQISSQGLDELQASLVKVNEALTNPASFGVMKIMVTAEAGAVIVLSKSESHMEIGIVPTLLECKAVILDRIKEIRPVEQIHEFRNEVIEKVSDESIRGQLLKVLDDHERKEEELSSRINRETFALDAGSPDVLAVGSIARLEARVDSLDKLVEKIDGNSMSRFDVATTLFAILAAFGVVIGVVLGVANWISN
ncbi:hypothetical protein [Nocardiopsis sp. Huas11]|uniref:hypothetical protein n=1 Tax=Nocardiopsis sp. Huas11 TaxID=2183912 RepID=UPI0011C35C7A|nr:hypothetical protein [Nocardiopsis sp. Huas11]